MSHLITVIIPTSYIPTHPDHRILSHTLDSVMRHLPGAPIIITCDGLTEDQEDHRADYLKYLHRIPRTFTVKISQTHTHQSGMMLTALPLVETPLVLYLEHDWTLGHPIEWEAISELILSGEANYVKFYQSFRIHPLHEHMMVERVILQNVPLIKTLQYSANPHLASTEWYRTLTPFFTGKTDYIENLLHGPIATAPWEAYKLMIYNPVHGDMKRSFHLDGAHSE